VESERLGTLGKHVEGVIVRRVSSLITALVLVVAACGDDASVLGDGSTTAAPATTAGEGATTTTGAAATATTASADGPGNPSGDIEAAFAAYETAALRTVYMFGEGGNQTQITISQDPNLDPPVSATLMGPDGEEGRFLTIGDRSIVCGPLGEECIEFPPGMGMDMGQALLGPLLTGFLSNSQLTTTPGFSVEQETATIGGRSGICFTFTANAFVQDADVEFVRQCIDDEFGFVLLVEYLETGDASVETVMELLEFGIPTPTDFEPSGPLTTMPTG
jgi:hypothetical protein